MPEYSLEFILQIHGVSPEKVKNSLREFGEDLEISLLPPENTDKDRTLKIHIRTEEPTVIFDACAEFGRIKSVKIN